MINVFILTFCRNLELFYGTELIFKTLRVGFPNAKVTVVDNASLPETRHEIELLAKKNDCQFIQLNSPGVQHHEFIKDTIYASAKNKTYRGPLAFLDPDVCFWHCCEEFDFDGLIAGKLFDKFFDYMTQTITMPRIHPSFFWVQDVVKLMDEIRKIKVKRFDFEPFLPYSCMIGEIWYRFDTGASLYAAISSTVSGFTEEHFNCYDHLYCGSHFDWVYPLYDTKSKEMMLEIHNYAKIGNYKALKGAWKYQLEVWRKSFPSQP